jgi:hypothetical protein
MLDGQFVVLIKLVILVAACALGWLAWRALA